MAKRDIKFRAKSKEGYGSDANGWIFGDYRHPIDNVEDYEHTITSRKDPYDDKGFQYKIYPGTLCQFIGATDKNGKEIYEGDIISADVYPFKDEKGLCYVAVIDWDEVNLKFEAYYELYYTRDDRSGISVDMPVSIDCDMLKSCEVIGNLWDNYDLILNGEDKYFLYDNDD